MPSEISQASTEFRSTGLISTTTDAALRRWPGPAWPATRSARRRDALAGTAAVLASPAGLLAAVSPAAQPAGSVRSCAGGLGAASGPCFAATSASVGADPPGGRRPRPRALTAWRSGEHPDPALDVVGHDGGRGARDAAHHRGDLVRGPVVQQPAEQRGVAAPGQHHGHVRVGVGCFPLDQFGRGPGQPAVRDVDEVERHAAVGPGPLLPELFGLDVVDDEVHGAHAWWAAGSARSAARPGRPGRSCPRRRRRCGGCSAAAAAAGAR